MLYVYNICYYIYVICVFMLYVYIHRCAITCRSQGTTHGIQFFPFFKWILGVEFRWSSLGANSFTQGASWLTPNLVFNGTLDSFASSYNVYKYDFINDNTCGRHFKIKNIFLFLPFGYILWEYIIKFCFKVIWNNSSLNTSTINLIHSLVHWLHFAFKF